MLLTLITYGRLESFRGFGFVQKQFEEYMKNKERQYVNKEAIKRYENTPATRREKKEKEENERQSASSKLSFRLLIDKKEREAYPDKLDPHRTLAKRLIAVLYGNQPFYKKLEEKRPAFVDEIFDRIMLETENQIKELANIEFADLELNEAFTNMLKGQEAKAAEKDKQIVRGNEGYPPLINFITLQPKKLVIRVYLASEPLLMAIYGNHDAVNEILTTRNRLYHEVKVRKAMTVQEAQEELTGLCGRFATDIPKSMLNFSVSNTNPKGY